MTDRETELRTLATAVCECDVVEDAWLAKSFTDRLFVVDLQQGADVPDELQRRLAEHDLYGTHKVYGTNERDASFVGTVSGVNRHQFVDVRTRGDHQSYVVE